VLGARRPEETPPTPEAPAVLGARRGRTDDTNNLGRYISMLGAFAAIILLLATRRRKDRT
jgi:hypothetical protein